MNNTILNSSLSNVMLSTHNAERCTTLQPTSKNLIFAIVLTLICIVTFLGNACVILTVTFHRSLHSVNYVLLVSLALSDLFVSMFSMPWRIHQLIHNGFWCLDLPTCAFWIWTDSFACCASITNLAAVGVERFIAIKAPLRYNSLMTQKTGLKMVVFVWSYALVWASLGNLNWSKPGENVFSITNQCVKIDPIYYTVVAVFAFYVPLAVVVVSYSYLTRVALIHASALQELVSPHFRERTRGCSFQSERTQRLVREVRATKMMAVVVGVFLVSWFPFFVLVLKNLWSPSPIHPILAEFTGVLFVFILPNLNSALNPFIYMAFTRELRQAFWSSLFKKLRQRKQSEVTV